MFEIIRGDQDAFDHYQYEKYIHPEAEYDFTFEDRWLIFHHVDRSKILYECLDMQTKKTKRISREPSVYLFEESREQLLAQILRAVAHIRPFPWNTFEPIDMIKAIFENILPAYGFALRPEQVRLSIMIYEGFMGKTVSICEAEVGSGKTMAYLVAGYIANLARRAATLPVMPVTIATSSVELQRAIVEKDIPRLSDILKETGLAPISLTAVLRKGKEHYFCLNRYIRYIDTKTRNASPTGKYPLIKHLSDPFARTAFDLDKEDLSDGVKNRICVSGGCKRCDLHPWCRYHHFVENAMNPHVTLTFQVTNHNLYLMSKSRDNLLRNSEFVVIDEAHKLKEAAQSVFGATLSEKLIPNYLNWIKTHCKDPDMFQNYSAALNALRYMNMILFDNLLTEFQDDDLDMDSHTIIQDRRLYFSMLYSIRNTINTLERLRSESGSHSMDYESIDNALNVLIGTEPMNYWVEQDENGFLSLCASPKYLDLILASYVWDPQNKVKYALLSGTMNANDNFHYFKREHGIQHLTPDQINDGFFPSPFDYSKQTRLYIADDLPWPDQEEEYYEEVADRIISLIKATNGHTAVLFTSYRALQSVYELTEPELCDDYDVIRMTRGNKTAIDTFRKSENGVLFASGSIWEGVDCAGDCLSSVIIVRVPFPRRSAIMELKCAECKSTRDFVRTYAVPEMLIKLRQGAGRLIRTETDTGVLAILDVRAVKSRHAKSIKKALRQYPLVSSVDEVAQFMKAIKPATYFADAPHNNALMKRGISA